MKQLSRNNTCRTDTLKFTSDIDIMAYVGRNELIDLVDFNFLLFILSYVQILNLYS